MDYYLPILALVPLPYVHPWKEKASRKASRTYKPPPSLSLGGARETFKPWIWHLPRRQAGATTKVGRHTRSGDVASGGCDRTGLREKWEHCKPYQETQPE